MIIPNLSINYLNNSNRQNNVNMSVSSYPAIKSQTKDIVSFSGITKTAPIQFHKDAGGTIALGKYPKNYVKLADSAFVEYKPQSIKKIGSRTFIIPEQKAHYLNTYALLPHYHIDKLWTAGKGTGTCAVQSVVQRSLNDAETEGRVTLDASCIDGKTAPGGFYYKLGFRFIQNDLNETCRQWIENGGKKEDAPFVTGTMYLPCENIEYCLNYNK